MKKNRPLAPATVSEAHGVRYLHLGSIWVQGAMRIKHPHAIELEYVQRMMAWMLFSEPSQWAQGHAVQLGLGSGALTRFCHRDLRMKTTVVELNRSVIDACRMWFRLPPDDERLHVLQADAADFVNDDANIDTAHVLHVDLYDHEAASPVLDDLAFYEACYRVLADQGVMVVNLFGRDSSFERSANRIAKAFGDNTVFRLAPTKEGNTIVMAGKNMVAADRETFALRADHIEQRHGLPAHKWMRLIRILPASGQP